MVCPVLLRPGKHQFLIKAGDEFINTKPKILISQARKESIPGIYSHISQKKKFQPFEKDRSVFSEWKENDPGTLKIMMDHDLKNWTAGTLIKIDFDSRSVNAFLRRNSQQIKDLFNALVAAGDRFPKISFATFINFCKATNIIENIEEDAQENKQNEDENQS